MTTLPQTTSVRLPQAAPPVGHSAGGGSMVPAQMSWADISRILRANIWLILAMLILSGAGGWGLHIWLRTNLPQYEAGGLLRLNPSVTIDPLTDRTVNMSDTRLLTELRTQAQLLTTEQIFSEVLKKSESPLRQTDWYKEYKEQDKEGINVKKAKEFLKDKFRASPVPDSILLRVSVSYGVPKDCKVIVEEIVNAHLEIQKTIARNNFENQTKTLREMKERVDRQISLVSNRMRERQQQLVSKGQGGEALRTGGPGVREIELRALIEAQLKAQSEAAEAEGMFRRVKAQMDRGEMLGEVDKAVEADPTIAALSRDLISYQINMGIQAGTEGRPEVAKLTKIIEVTRQQLDDRRKDVRQRLLQQYVGSLEGSATQTKSQYEALTKAVDVVKKDLASTALDMALYVSDKDEEESLRKEQQQISNKLRDMEVSINPASQARIDWAPNGQPEVPELPSFPIAWKVIGSTMFLGLGLALGIALLREMMDQTVRSPRDISRVGQMELLGIIADESDDPQAANARLPIFDAPHSLTAEQFRHVRTRLQHVASLDTTRTIMVTGAGPMDGKTTVAANLAAGLALNGRRILLVDANFRRPELHRLFGLSNEKGFSDALETTKPFEETVHASRIPNLSVMTSGAKPMNATELFESQLLTDFIERALEDFDHVIFDGGPLLVVSEAMALAPRVDGVISVVRAHTESRGLLQRMKEALKQVRAAHLGVILNAVRARGGGYYGRNIKTFYNYQAEE